MVGSAMGKGKNDYDDGGIIQGLFLGPKQKVTYAINNGCLKKHITLKGIYGNINMITDDEV